jgi:hypothetical protein
MSENEKGSTEIVERIETPSAPISETSAFLAMIERAALNPAVDVDKMMKLMDMRDKFMERQAKVEFDAALAIMQPQLPQVDRNGRIVIYSKADREKSGGPTPNDRPQQSTPYALWEDINAAIGPHLAEHGFALRFGTGMSPDGKITVTATLSHKGGHREETTITLQHDSSGSKNPIQAIGSSIAYGKKYTAGLLLNITSRAPGDSDDDGTKAGEPAVIDSEQVAIILDLIKRINKPTAEKTFLDYFKIGAVFDLPAKDFDRAVKALEAKVAK